MLLEDSYMNLLKTLIGTSESSRMKKMEPKERKNEVKKAEMEYECRKRTSLGFFGLGTSSTERKYKRKKQAYETLKNQEKLGSLLKGDLNALQTKYKEPKYFEWIDDFYKRLQEKAGGGGNKLIQETKKFQLEHIRFIVDNYLNRRKNVEKMEDTYYDGVCALQRDPNEASLRQIFKRFAERTNSFIKNSYGVFGIHADRRKDVKAFISDFNNKINQWKASGGGKSPKKKKPSSRTKNLGRKHPKK